VGVLVLSQYVETRHATKLPEETPEAVGYLLKDRVSDVTDFVDAVHRVRRGGSAIDPEVVASLLGRRREQSAISEWLFLSPKTVETHVGAVLSELGLLPAADDHRRVLAVLMYLGS
jgi:DNA-binding NarL/FixJ family response regulator